MRSEVFVVEQQCVYQDVDGDDLVGENRHLLGWRDGELVAYARILKNEEEFAPVVIGRVIVSPAARGAEARLSADGAGAGQLSAALAAKGDLPRGAGAPAILYAYFGFTPVTEGL